jgi:hypothetical protein
MLGFDAILVNFGRMPALVTDKELNSMALAVIANRRLHSQRDLLTLGAIQRLTHGHGPNLV